MKEIYLAGGCFWGTEAYFKEIKGVVATSVGYANGNTSTTTYSQLKKTNHAEVVYVQYDPKIVGLHFLLEMYYKVIDPCSVNKQGNDVGAQYRTGIYYTGGEDRAIIENSIAQLAKKLKKKVAIEVEPLQNYVDAEKEHQDYLEKNPHGYCHIGMDSLDMAKKATPIPELTPLQYHVTQENGTEPPYQNDYWDFYEEGIYLDIVTGEPLFSSTDKFPCHGGWASFAKPIQKGILTETQDYSHGMIRTEVKSSKGSTHLGHVFPDGPTERGGLRYCINSASLRFIPKDELEEEGFGEYLSLFTKE